MAGTCGYNEASIGVCLFGAKWFEVFWKYLVEFIVGDLGNFAGFFSGLVLQK